MTVSATATLPRSPSFTFVVNTATTVPAGSQGYVALFDPAANTWTTLLGPVAIGGALTTWTFPAGASPMTFLPGGTYVFALFTASGTVPTPTPVPTASPTPGVSSEFNVGPLAAGKNQPISITAGSDGALWFVEDNSSGTDANGHTYAGQIGRISTSGTSTLFAVPGRSARLFDIASGSDGALWFTGNTFDDNQTSLARIGRIAAKADASGPVGTVTLYDTQFTVGIISPIAITAGPDGALWFTGAGFNIGRITTAGASTGYRVRPGSSDFLSPLTGIAAGSDGALYYVGSEQNNNGPQPIPIVGRITTTGTFTDYSGAAATAGVKNPQRIAAGPNSTLWFTDSYHPAGNTASWHAAIGVLTTSGAISEYALPASAAPFGITLGPDGALWFADASTNAIGRITTGGSITQYPAGISAGAAPFGITRGPDGAIWFTERDANNVGRLFPPATAPSALRRSGGR